MKCSICGWKFPMRLRTLESFGILGQHFYQEHQGYPWKADDTGLVFRCFVCGDWLRGGKPFRRHYRDHGAKEIEKAVALHVLGGGAESKKCTRVASRTIRAVPLP